ncbi:MAG: sigma factor-like helix-turn-helix DNA-binding protein [Stenotrophomonas maltophilia]
MTLPASDTDLRPCFAALLEQHRGIDDHDHRQIAEVLGISVANVSTRLHRRRQLQPTQTVLEQSQQLAALRRHTAVTELLLGLPWCWLWLAVPVLVAWQAWGVDLGAIDALSGRRLARARAELDALRGWEPA